MASSARSFGGSLKISEKAEDGISGSSHAEQRPARIDRLSGTFAGLSSRSPFV
jgi:hypothetical protein